MRTSRRFASRVRFSLLLACPSFSCLVACGSEPIAAFGPEQRAPGSTDAATTSDAGASGNVDDACERGRRSCGGACVDLETDPANCGGCGNACGAVAHGTASCRMGACALVCDEGFSEAASACAPIVPLTSIPSALAVGDHHSCALVAGAVKCWGKNDAGQLGIATSTRLSKTPVQVQGLAAGVTAIAASRGHTCAIVSGAMKCWGRNGDGELGNGTFVDSSVPVQVSGLGAGVTAIALGYRQSCAIVSGALKCWGDNAWGQAGDGTTGGQHPQPSQVPGLTSGVTAVAVGGTHTCAIVSGALTCWGTSRSGQVGIGMNVSSAVPAQVPGFASGVSLVTAGSLHTCAVVSNAAKCWGAGFSPVPQAVPTLSTGVQLLAAASDTTCALQGSGVVCWGAGYDGVLGNGSTADSSQPVQVKGLSSGVRSIAAAGTHACAMTAGSVYCWGSNESGELGNGQTASSSVPVAVTGL